MNPGEDSFASRNLQAAAFLVGGACMAVGSFYPWTHAALNGQGITVYRNGLQLGFNDSFSLAGLLSVIFGVRAAIAGTLRLAERRVPRLVDQLPLLDGLVGVGVGLFGVGAATWYVGQVTKNQGTLFVVGAGYGVWIVLVGGTFVLAAGTYDWLYKRRPQSDLLGTLILIALIGVSAYALAP